MIQNLDCKGSAWHKLALVPVDAGAVPWATGGFLEGVITEDQSITSV